MNGDAPDGLIGDLAQAVVTGLYDAAGNMLRSAGGLSQCGLFESTRRGDKFAAGGPGAGGVANRFQPSMHTAAAAAAAAGADRAPSNAEAAAVESRVNAGLESNKLKRVGAIKEKARDKGKAVAVAGGAAAKATKRKVPVNKGDEDTKHLLLASDDDECANCM